MAAVDSACGQGLRTVPGGWCAGGMPQLLDIRTRTDAIVHAVTTLIAAHGMAGVTTRNIARESGVPVSSLAHHLTNRARLMSVVAHRTGKAFLDDLVVRRPVEGMLAFLPASAEDLEHTRVWLAWCDLARGDASVSPHVSGIERDEVALFSQEFRERPSHDDVDTGIALVRGLRHAVCAGDDPMPVERARALLAAWAEPYRSDAASALDRSSAIIRSGSAAE